jgi:hypothetical protein
VRWVQVPWYTYHISWRLVQALENRLGVDKRTDTQTARWYHKPN